MLEERGGMSASFLLLGSLAVEMISFVVKQREPFIYSSEDSIQFNPIQFNSILLVMDKRETSYLSACDGMHQARFKNATNVTCDIPRVSKFLSAERLSGTQKRIARFRTLLGRGSLLRNL